MPSTTEPHNRELEQQKLLAALPLKDVAPLWTVMAAMVPPRPAPKASSALWKYDEIRPYLIESGRVVNETEAERRVLMLVNPSMQAPYTTDTLYAGLQLIMPQETAPAHRHTAFALRYIIEGERGFTAVEGRKVYMKKGDVILTPSWQWHDHGHEGDGPMIWLDGLDLPLYQAFPTNFAEHYQSKRYPSEPVSSSPLLFPWADVLADLVSQDGPHAVYSYATASGAEISKTIGAQAERIASGATSSPRRETLSFVFHVAQGHGRTRLVLADGAEKVLEWNENDTFAVPAWTAIAHTCTGEGDAYLFAFSDRPLLQSLGMYRKE